MKNNMPLNIKRCDFLEAVYCVYKDCSINYVIALRDALTIIISHRRDNAINFHDYVGRISL